MKNQIKERIILALDVNSEKEALDLVLKLKDYVGFFKVGLELYNSEGKDIVKKIIDIGGNVFLDLKFNDIPNTVGGASKAVTGQGVDMFNVHANGGFDMMVAAANAATEEASRMSVKRPKILGVTVLTSIGQKALNQELRIVGRIEDQVVHLAKLAEKAGLDGIISSPREIDVVRKNVSRDMIVVTPGIRPTWAASQDQKRIMTPREAFQKGASYIVIGRPITRPPQEIGTSVDAVKKILEEIMNIV